MNLKQKNGTSKIISVYWFVILILVAGSIVYMVSIFYGAPYDVREIEGNILINKVADCLSEKGKLKYELTEEFKNDFLKICYLNFNTGDEEIQYYLEIEFYNFENQQALDFKIIEGNINLKNFFEVSSYSNSIFKSEKSFYVLSEKNDELTVKIFSIIRKTEKNVV